MAELKIARLYTGGDGESRFGEIDIPLEDIGGQVRASKIIKATGLMFREGHAEYNRSWHNPPRRVFFVTLEGTLEVGAGDGTKRIFGPGSIFLEEDLTGRGHEACTLGHQTRKSLMITLD